MEGGKDRWMDWGGGKGGGSWWHEFSSLRLPFCYAVLLCFCIFPYSGAWSQASSEEWQNIICPAYPPCDIRLQWMHGKVWCTFCLCLYSSWRNRTFSQCTGKLLCRHETIPDRAFCSQIRTVISAWFLWRSEAAQHRSWKLIVAYRIGVSHSSPQCEQVYGS